MQRQRRRHEGTLTMGELAKWESFYVIVGGAAAALIGLQFVVLTLIAERPQLTAPEAATAFATPTIVHFGTALLVAALTRVPWETITSVAVLWGIVGLFGTGYEVVVARRMRMQKAYQPDLEDWMFHLVLPLAAYVTLGLSAFWASSRTEDALLAVGGAALSLLFISIHNTWDAVSYHVFVNMRKSGD
jgi:hypothetical protein